MTDPAESRMERLREGLPGGPEPAAPVQPVEDLEYGAQVFAAGGELLGYVSEVNPQHFKVSAPGAPDYWLDRETVRESTSVSVAVSFPLEELGGHRLDRPAPSDALLSPEERAHQRAVMESELARQRAARR